MTDPNPSQASDAVDWDDEGLWDRLDEDHGVRDLEPFLRTYTAYLVSIGWRPPESTDQTGVQGR